MDPTRATLPIPSATSATAHPDTSGSRHRVTIEEVPDEDIPSHMHPNLSIADENITHTSNNANAHHVHTLHVPLPSHVNDSLFAENPSRYKPPLSVKDAKAAWEDIRNLLEPRRKCGKGHLPFSGDDQLRRRMEQIRMFLWKYIKGISSWTIASLETAQDWEVGDYKARQIRVWTRKFISDRHALPISKLIKGDWNACLLDRKPELKTALCEHFQTIGKYVCAMDIVDFMQQPAVMQEHNLTKPISLSTAQAWMHRLSFQWSKAPTGQFVDGHERDDVVDYRMKTFLPALAELSRLARTFRYFCLNPE